MKQRSFILGFLSLFSVIACSCGVDCIEKKTGLSKSSQTLKASRDQDLFLYELIPMKSSYRIDNRLSMILNDAWVEKTWKFECVNNKPEIVKGNSSQMIIDAGYEGNALNSGYCLGSCQLGSQLTFKDPGTDTVRLELYKDVSDTAKEDRVIIDTVILIKIRSDK